MEFWLLAGLGVYLLQVYAAAAIYLPTEGMATHLGGRDNLPEKGIMAGRADKALANMKENLPVFLTLGLLAVVVEGADSALAAQGAMIWVLARAAYFFAYLATIPYLRSIIWGISLVGLVMMLFSVL